MAAGSAAHPAERLLADRPCAPETAPAITGTAARIIDGDTFILDDGTVVRLAGIAAPKRALGKPEGEPSPLADQAHSALENLIAGQNVTLAPAAANPDRHGRIHAEVRQTSGALVQAALLSAGTARVRPSPDESLCLEPLLAIERSARASRRGIWSGPDYATRMADDPSIVGRSGHYELVEGRVVSVGHGARLVFLNFGRDFRSDFTIMIENAAAGRFAEAGTPLDGLANRRIRVRGFLEESGGPAIRVSDPAEIELLDDGENAGD
jgi:endonuclease YncB( thermonuclease family)